jgi:hypothetical protein
MMTGLRQPGLSQSVAAWTGVVQASPRLYTQMLCHIPYVSMGEHISPQKRTRFYILTG